MSLPPPAPPLPTNMGTNPKVLIVPPLASQLQGHTFKNTNVSTVVKQLPGWATQDAPLGGERDTREYYDVPTIFKEKVATVANMISSSEHVVVYTGAGISTSASIPDYRGPDGLWTRMEKGAAEVALKDLDQAKPTLAHCALAALAEKGLIHFVTSTNLDGLHLRSGLPESKLAELHGNTYKESCEKCHLSYHRPFDCTKKGTRADHWTGRICESCGEGRLLDNIVNFGEQLPAYHLDRATHHSYQADLAIVLGTSMLVAPACCLPENAKKYIICNLQKTPYDDKAEILLRGKTDTFMKLLLFQLGIEIPTINPQGQSVDDTTKGWEEEHIKHSHQ